MPTDNWKHVERDVAALFGTRRTPLSGSNSGHDTQSDTLHPTLYIETKLRIKHAACALYYSEVEKARSEGKPLVIALKQRRQHGFLLVVHPDDIQFVANVITRNRRRSWPKFPKSRRSS